MAGNLDFAMVLRLVDKVSAPARTASSALGRIGAAAEAAGRQGTAWANRQIETNNARRQALRGEAFGLAAAAAAAGAALRPAIQFERAMAGVGAVARADEDQLARLTATARELGATTAWSASEAAEGMRFLAMSGFGVNDTVAAMPGMLNLASAGAVGLGQASDIATNILSGFRMEAAEMGRLGDVLTNTFTSSNTDLAMLGETMKQVAPNAAGLGVSLEQTAAMAGKLGDAGIQGSQAGTALRAMFIRMASLPKPAEEALEELGVKTMDASGNLRDLPTVLAEVQAALKPFGSGRQAKLITDIFGMEASSAATVLLQQAGSGALQSYAESLAETGSAARVAARLNDNTGGALKRLQSIAESLAISFGTILLPQVTALLDAVVPAVAALQSWADAHPELISRAAQLAAALLALRLGSVVLRWALLNLLGPVFHIVRAAGLLLVLLPRLALGFAALLNPMKLVRGTLIALRFAFLATGIGALLAGVAMAGIWIYNNWEGLQSFFSGFWQSFRAALGPAAPLLDGIVQAARRLWDWFAALLGPIEAGGEQWLTWGERAGTALGGTVGRVAAWAEANAGLLRTLGRLYLGLLALRLVLGTLRWGLGLGALIAPLRWTALLIPKLTAWLFARLALGGAGKLALAALIAPLRWTALLIPKLTAWLFARLALGGAGKLALAALIAPLRWTALLIPKLTAALFARLALGGAGKLALAALIAPLRWTALLIPKLTAWLFARLALGGAGKLALAALIAPLRWTALLIPKLTAALFARLALGGAGKLALAALIAPLRWTALLPKLNWSLLITPLKWGSRLIPVIGWAILAGELLWSLLIKPLGWDKYLPKIDWDSIFGAFSWDGWIPAIDWDRIVGSISWPQPPSWLQWLIGEEEPAQPRLSDAAGFDALPEHKRAAVRTLETVAAEGELPTADYRAGLQEHKADLEARIADLEVPPERSGHLAVNDAFIDSARLKQLQEELAAVNAEIEESALRAGDLSRALMAINDTDAAPEISRDSIDAALTDAATAIPPASPRDRGGPVRRNIPYIVGERGRELFVPAAAGAILPNRALQAALAASVAAAPAAALASPALPAERPEAPPALSVAPPAPQILRQGDNITIHIHPAPGLDPRDIAREVERVLARRHEDRRADLHDGLDYR